jgi:phosphate transport system protein
MTVHLQRQIDKLKQHILTLGSNVERAVDTAIRAVNSRDPQLARQVIDGDTAIDQMEVDIEEACLHTLALNQPVAFDLRYVVAVLKINNELERIADMAVNIAEQAIFLADEPATEMPFDLDGMFRQVTQMLRRALQAMVDVDTDAADWVRAADDRVDAIHRQMYEQVETAMRVNPADSPQLIHAINLSKQLERIADQCVNIAEDVIYLARGDILRHAHSNIRRPSPAAE